MLLAQTAFLAFMTLVPCVLSHGRLMDPPARNSMWRLGFPNPVNYNDNELYCGGRVTQWARNNGKCGVCGDPHHHPNKDHEVGGKYANGIISRQYKQGDAIDVTVHITANHKGYFEFRICPVKDPKEEVTQGCLDEHVMQMTNGEGARFALPEGKSNTFFNVSLRLPADMTCSQCVIQWKYRTGNTWDKDENGKFCVGCGPQEEFYNCADVAIHAGDKKVVTTEDEKMVVSQEKIPENKKSNENEVSQKNGGIKVTDEKVPDKITEYGKQKVHFYQKLQKNKYSTKSEVVGSESGKEMLSRQIGKVEPSQSQTDSIMRFGYINNDYNNLNLARNDDLMSVQPSGVASQWKAGNSNIPAYEKIRRRFGYVSSPIRKDASHHRNPFKQPTTDSTAYGDEQIKNNHQDEFRRDRNYNSHKVATKTIAGSRYVPVTTMQTEVNSITTEQSGNAAFDNTAMKLHANLGKKIHNMNPQQRDNFLGRWKLLRLRYIAALKALNATSVQSKIKPSLHTERYTNKMSKQPELHLKTASPAAEELDYHKETNSRKTVSSPTPQSWKFYQNKIQDSRQSYLKNKLPSWLMKSLKHRQPEPDSNIEYHTSDNNRQMTSSNIVLNSNVGVKMTSSNIVHNSNAGLNEENKHPKWYNIVKDNSNLEADNKFTTPRLNDNQYEDNQYEDNQSENSREFGTTGSKNNDIPSKRTTQFQHNFKSEDKILNTNINSKSSNLLDKESDKKDKTESLVRHIVSLLFSRKNKKGMEKSAENSDTRGQYVSDKMRTEGISLKNNITHGYSQFEPVQVGLSSMVGSDLRNEDRIDRLSLDNDMHNNHRSWAVSDGNEVSPMSTKDLESRDRNRMSLDHDRQDNHRQNLFTTDIYQTQQYNIDTNNPPPSVRADALPFKGLILGSDYEYVQDQSDRVFKQSKERFTERQNDGLNTHGTNLITSPNYENNPHKREHRGTRLNNQKNVLKQTQKNWWINSQGDRSSTDRNDYHHLWAERSQRRQNYYKIQQDKMRSQLTCRSLVTLGGGMNQWCTDNCKANFCPPAMCVCTRSSVASSYVSGQRSSLSYGNSLPRKQVKVRRNNRPAIYTSPDYKPQTVDNYETGTSLMEDQQTSLHPSSENEESYFKQNDILPPAPQGSIHQSSTRNNMISNRNNMNLLSYNSIGPDSNHIQELERITQSEGVLQNSIDRSANADPYYSYNSEKLIGRHSDYATGGESGIDHLGMQEPIRRYNIREPRHQSAPYVGNSIVREPHLQSATYVGNSNIREPRLQSPPYVGNSNIRKPRLQSPPYVGNSNTRERHFQSAPYVGSNNNINTNFYKHNKNTERPVRISWISGTRQKQHILENQSKERDTINFMKPYSSSNNPKDNINSILSTDDSVSQDNSYNTQEIIDDSNVGQNQLYPHFVNTEHPIRQEVLNCKAIGAHAGVKHFDEWCNLTCQGTVCPLLICSCES